ncbi:MAG TPA: TolC family protein [Chthoniobacteraceae bacterium]|jgi:outer membrane protein TolC|nr:TolC family protein [Chthoniobacteraceae bacterium]
MKTILTLILSSFALATAHAEQPLEEILRKRDAVLSELLEIAKTSHKEGRTTEVEVHEASLRLYSFRRDAAKSQAERIKWQEQIVTAEKAAAADVKPRIAIGVLTPKDALLAEERILTAEQRLAELRLKE